MQALSLPKLTNYVSLKGVKSCVKSPFKLLKSDNFAKINNFNGKKGNQQR